MSIKSLYKEYFQKSRVFLYPALEIKRGSSIMPIQSYMAWEGNYDLQDRKLICLYYTRDDEEFVRFERQKLVGNILFHDFIQIDQEKGVYVFDFKTMAPDWDLVLEGKYSKLSAVHKKKVKGYYGIYNANFVYIESYLNPEKYYSIYAEMLGVDVEDLQKVGELCSKPDFDKEILVMEKKLIDLKQQTTNG